MVDIMLFIHSRLVRHGSRNIKRFVIHSCKDVQDYVYINMVRFDGSENIEVKDAVVY